MAATKRILQFSFLLPNAKAYPVSEAFTLFTLRLWTLFKIRVITLLLTAMFEVFTVVLVRFQVCWSF